MSATVAILDQPALVLNRHWVPIHLTTARHALMLVYQRVARAVHPADLSLHQFQTWADLRVPDDTPCVRTVSQRIAVPEVVVLERYGRIPNRTVPFNRKNLFARDEYCCQYCGSRLETRDLTIDHVVPRVQGGISSWENCVLACITCNRRKAHRTPDGAGMRLKRSPHRPRWTPRHLFTGMPRRASWERIIGDAYWNVRLEP
jgi:5-methylcytosine-specific restriction endonuclease McrA